MAVRDRFLVARAARYAGGHGHSNDALLRARRVLEDQWHLDLGALPAGPDWREAARLLERAGEPQLAAVLDAIAGTDAELGAAAQAWTARYAFRGNPAAEQILAGWLHDGTLIPDEGLCWQGADGAWYQTGVLSTGPGQPGDPVVLVTTMATRELVAGFGTERAALGWLTDRYRDGHGRALAIPAVEHLPRVTLEEQLLAWLLHHPGEAPGVMAALPGPVWTADCRHEIAAALRTAAGNAPQAGYREVSSELGRRLLRAPGWAAGQVGWPAGHWAQQYLRRLGATPVTSQAAEEAARALAVEDRDRGLEPLPAQPPAPGPSPSRHRPAGSRPGPDQQARRLAAGHVLDLPPLLPRPYSMGSRMRLSYGDRPPGPRPDPI